ncbi:probable E3 ubiquitin-protein ligase XBOS32 isoform X1 [Cryptomeria japonica]|uniref:probable E3 ubiquitin-protein ligase XBOS32 isoform X1 n=1 Tax=Cryptomeria japonica TaxID=3369 RepID=UPI0025ACAA86|nr:probable E3 ubiquitin-protein ligase XBOS32 isoform X1 [Cryptomeria japonica]
MRILNFMGNSFGCSASGERLVSAAREGDLQEAKALLECNPRLAKYSTFGVRNSPLHYSAAQGHNEIVSLLLESGVEVNIRNYCGQTALMQACRYGHWEVVQTLVLYKANVNRADYLNGRTALHFAAVNGHSRCVRLLFADVVPSLPSFWHNIRTAASQEGSLVDFDPSPCSRIVNRPADGGITALHMAALNGHAECVQLLLDLGANESFLTVQDGSTIDLIGANSTPLHYAACGGNVQCCQMLIARGASCSAQNANGWTPLQVARLWRRQWLEGLLAHGSQAVLPCLPPSRYLALPLMSIVQIARECGWRNLEPVPVGVEPCAVCLERRCTVAAEGCGHELCTRCALYLCSTNNIATTVSGPPGSIPCPMCRHGIVSFIKLAHTSAIKELGRSNLPLSLCTACSTEVAEPTSLSTALCNVDYRRCRVSPVSNSSVRVLTCQRFPFNSSFCIRDPESAPSAAHCNSEVSENPGEAWQIARTTPMGSTSEHSTTAQIDQSASKSPSVHTQDSASQVESRWWRPSLFSWSHYTVASQS